MRKLDEDRRKQIVICAKGHASWPLGIRFSRSWPSRSARKLLWGKEANFEEMLMGRPTGFGTSGNIHRGSFRKLDVAVKVVNADVVLHACSVPGLKSGQHCSCSVTLLRSLWLLCLIQVPPSTSGRRVVLHSPTAAYFNLSSIAMMRCRLPKHWSFSSRGLSYAHSKGIAHCDQVWKGSAH